jgi:hypothetical protein
MKSLQLMREFEFTPLAGAVFRTFSPLHDARKAVRPSRE